MLTENIFDLFFISTPILLLIQSIIIYIISKTNFKNLKFSKYLFIIFVLISTFSIFFIINDISELPHLENKIIVQDNNNNIYREDDHLLDIETNIIDHDNQINNSQYCNLQYSDNFISYLAEIRESIEYNNNAPSFKSNDIIAEDILSGDVYSLNQLSKEKLFISYMEDDKEILFYGSYNYNNLDGDCIFNIYINNKLITILEATYEKGILLSYKRVTDGITQVGTSTWNISYRENKIDYNTGVTLNYFKYEDYIKNFDYENANPTDIISVSMFENYLKEISILEGYYNGNTSAGYYNDNTGNAYMIKFFEDGTVRMLYHGNFSNGYPDDNTGSAWDIVKNKNTNYMYYKGCFKNGSTTNNKGFVFENNLSIERINEILDINNLEISFDLNWSKSSEDS